MHTDIWLLATSSNAWQKDLWRNTPSLPPPKNRESYVTLLIQRQRSLAYPRNPLSRVIGLIWYIIDLTTKKPCLYLKSPIALGMGLIMKSFIGNAAVEAYRQIYRDILGWSKYILENYCFLLKYHKTESHKLPNSTSNRSMLYFTDKNNMHSCVKVVIDHIHLLVRVSTKEPKTKLHSHGKSILRE